MCSYADICCISFYMTSYDLYVSWFPLVCILVHGINIDFCLLFCFKFFKCFQLLALYFASDGSEITSFEYPVQANSSLRLERKRLRESFYLLICLPKDFPPNARRRRKASL